MTAGLYLPFEIHALVAHPGFLSLTVLSINLIVIAELARDLLKRRY